ncbi:hypothetical protein A9Q95_15600 [Rhodobacterales bacterium 59_46_T64]|nr:hypothetical protein A9Q95_15600 [Rhodobacterales bacterium 59_46_T64]
MLFLLTVRSIRACGEGWLRATALPFYAVSPDVQVGSGVNLGALQGICAQNHAVRDPHVETAVAEILMIS